MPIVSQGTTQEFRVGATDGIFVKCTGSAAITYDNEFSAPTLADTTTGEVRCGFFGSPATIRVNCVSGTCEVNAQPTVIKKLVSKQSGAAQDSSALDVAEVVNGLALAPATQQQTVILFGDSYAATQGGRDENTSSLSLYRFLIGRLGNSISVVKNAGVSGNTSEQMLARIDTDVLPFESDWVFFNCGVNDFFGFDRSLSAVQSDVTEILSKLLADGRKVLIFNCPPQVSTRSNFTAGKSTRVAQYNNWLASYVASLNGVLLADIYSPFVNWSDTTNGGAVADGFAGDGIHLSTFGEIIAAQQAISALNFAFGQDLSLLNSPLDAGIAGSEGLFIGTSGTNGTGSSGSVATSYTSSRASGANGAIVNSKLPLRGQRQTVTLTASNGDVLTRLNGNLLAELTPFIGKKVRAQVLMRLRTASGGVSLKDLVVKLYTAVGGSFFQAVNGTTTAQFPPLSDNQFDTGVVLLTLRDLTIESGINSAGMYFELRLDSIAGGVVELDIYGVDIREVL